MFKKLLLVATAMLAISSNVFASNGAPYLGASLGVTDNTASNSGAFRGMPVTLFAGYGQSFQNIYLGGELFGTLGTLTLSNDSAGSSSLKSTYGYGASFIPGYLLSDRTIAFLRAGLVRTRFSNISSTATGGQLGLGLQTNLMQNWDVRGEYDYTKYSSVNGGNPRADLFNVGLVYKID